VQVLPEKELHQYLDTQTISAAKKFTGGQFLKCLVDLSIPPYIFFPLE
jgi:hypothetical protein